MRCLDCVLEATKPALLTEKELREKAGLKDILLNHAKLRESLREKKNP